MKKIIIKMNYEGTQEEVDKIPFFLEPVIIKTVNDEFPPIYQIYIHFEIITDNAKKYLSEIPENIKKFCVIKEIPNTFRFIMSASDIYIDSFFNSDEEIKIQKPNNVTNEVWESVLWDIRNKDFGEFHYSQFTGFFKKLY